MPNPPMTRLSKTASLRIPASIQHLPSVRDFLEDAARRFLFGNEDCLRITLAGEEIFTYVCSLDASGGTIDVGVHSVDYQLRVSFLFDAAQFDPWAFNLGVQVLPDDEASLEGLGLLLASRTVDGFAITLRQSGRVELLLVKDKSYPEEPVPPSLSAPFAEYWHVRDATSDDIRQFVARLRQTSSTENHPAFLAIAGRLVDMVASGDYGMVVAVDGSDTVLGGALWHERSERSIESFGPYIVTESATDCGRDLIEALLGRIAKQRALCLLSRWTTPAMPQGEFELLGEITLRDAQGGGHVMPMAYRQLKEDLGSRVWVVPEIENFLRDEYDRLFFAREMVAVDIKEPKRPAHSVLAAEIDRLHGAVTLSPVLDGGDAEENLHRQLAVFVQENLPNIFFEIDLAFAWQVALTPILLNNGFIPRLMMPYAGKADIVLFQKAFA